MHLSLQHALNLSLTQGRVQQYTPESQLTKHPSHNQGPASIPVTSQIS